MEKKLNECYIKIYELCKKAIPLEWRQVKIWTEKYDQIDCWQYHPAIVYQDVEGEWHRSGDIEEEFSTDAFFQFCMNIPSKVVKEIYAIFTEAGIERFKVFTYTVDAEGHFEVNFQYEYAQGENFIERMTLWEYETTGFTGADFHKTVIKKYHPEFEG